MRFLLAAFLVYLLGLVQLGLAPAGPDLVLLALLVYALHEKRLNAALLGFFAGLCIDLASPHSLGANVLSYTLLAYGTASLHSFVYRGRGHMLFLALVGIALRYTVQLLARSGLPGVVPMVVSAGLTLVLAIPADRLLSRLLYARWKTA